MSSRGRGRTRSMTSGRGRGRSSGLSDRPGPNVDPPTQNLLRGQSVINPNLRRAIQSTTDCFVVSFICSKGFRLPYREYYSTRFGLVIQFRLK